MKRGKRGMELKIRFLNWSAGLPVAMLNYKTAKKIGVHTKDRVSIKTGSKEVSTIVDTIRGLVKENEIVVSSELKKRLSLKSGQKVDVSLAPKSRSSNLIKKKLDGKRLLQKEINIIIDDVVNNSLSEAEIALFISAMYEQGMNFKETVYLINAISKSGNKVGLKNKLIVDKHSIGGIAGNRTTPIIVSICVAAGLTFPKTSSRAITSAAGTADVIETVAKVDFSIKELKKIVKKTGGCMVWGGALGLVPADSKIIKIEKMLGIDPESQLLASIMSKKIAVGSNHILIDIPYGKCAKVSKIRAKILKKKFERLGKYFKKKIKCVLTDGSQPIGNGIGPVLEMKDVIKILDPKKEGPKDLEDKALFLAAKILEMSGKTEKGLDMAKEILYSGKAFSKFKDIIKAQRGSIKDLKVAKFKKDILSKRKGKIKLIDNKKINFMARIAGCPMDKGSGLYLYIHKGDKVKKGSKILTVYSESKSRLNQAVKFYNDKKLIKIRRL